MEKTNQTPVQVSAFKGFGKPVGNVALLEMRGCVKGIGMTWRNCGGGPPFNFMFGRVCVN